MSKLEDTRNGTKRLYAMRRQGEMNGKTKHGVPETTPRLAHSLHPAWVALIRHCQEMGFGEIERLKIQDGVPVMAEKSIQRLKLS